MQVTFAGCNADRKRNWRELSEADCIKETSGLVPLAFKTLKWNQKWNQRWRNPKGRKKWGDNYYGANLKPLS